MLQKNLTLSVLLSFIGMAYPSIGRASSKKISKIQVMALSSALVEVVRKVVATSPNISGKKEYPGQDEDAVQNCAFLDEAKELRNRFGYRKGQKRI